MASITIEVLTAPETALVLRQLLGPFCAWDDWLSDRRRGKAAPLADFDLQPCTRIRDRCPRPVYAVKDIKAFVQSFREHHSESAAKTKPKSHRVQIDTEDVRSWKARISELIP